MISHEAVVVIAVLWSRPNPTATLHSNANALRLYILSNAVCLTFMYAMRIIIEDHRDRGDRAWHEAGPLRCPSHSGKQRSARRSGQDPP